MADMKHLASALAESLEQLEADYGEEGREIRAKLAEAYAEAVKHEPNGTKLKAILADCGDMEVQATRVRYRTSAPWHCNLR